ncbi:MAG: NADH-quinone oxidoreductase subunit N [Candidatus Neomarinimicrobiota bacterium]
MTNLESLSYFVPELILTGTILAAILADLFYSADRSGRVGWWVLTGLILAGGAVILTGARVPVPLFLGAIADDPFGAFFKLVILAATVFTVAVSRHENDLRNQRRGEYYILLVIMVLGLFLMVAAVDLIMVYLSIEVVSITSFVLAGYLKGDQRSGEASLKYIIYGAFSSGIMLFGLSILFGVTGTTRIYEIRNALAMLGNGADLALILAVLFIMTGFGYKISAVPFHYWTPDVYEGAPTSITAYLSVAPKAAGFALLIRFFNSLLGDPTTFIASEWTSFSAVPWIQLLAVLAVATMTLGNLIALRQDSVKRMLAYSSIAHAGYLMMGLPVLSLQGINGIMIYAVVYLCMNLGAFYIVLNVYNQTGSEDFEAFAGLGARAPLPALLMTLFMFSLTGIPPTAGFIGKFYLFAAVIKAGPGFYWLAIVGVLNSVVSLYYYLRVVKMMYFEQTGQRRSSLKPSFITVLAVLLALPTLILGIYWTPLADWVRYSLMIFTQGM